MNERLQEFARQEIKNGLGQLPDDWQHRFKQMYWADAATRRETPIDVVVDQMPPEKLDWAMQQIDRSLQKYNQQHSVGGTQLLD